VSTSSVPADCDVAPRARLASPALNRCPTSAAVRGGRWPRAISSRLIWPLALPACTGGAFGYLPGIRDAIGSAAAGDRFLDTGGLGPGAGGLLNGLLPVLH